MTDHNFRPEYAVDDNNGTLWRPRGMGQEWLEIDLGRLQQIQTIWTQFEYGTQFYQYLIETSTDGKRWTIFADKRNNHLAGSPIVFIAKPFNVASLDARIRQLLDVRTAIKENIRKELIIDPKETLITSDDDKFVANIINVIEDNIADVEFNIDKLASLLNISRSTLYRRAMEITNLSPSDLIRKRRMRRAAELLKQTSHPVSEICYMVGYSDQRYFGQSFKKEFGMTPKQYSIQKKV